MTTADLATRPASGSANAMPRGAGRAAVFLLLCGAVIFLAVRSFHHSDMLAVYSWSGNIQGVLSHRGRLVVGLSNLSFGPEVALTGDVATESTEKGEELYQKVYKDWATRRERLGFGWARSEKGDVVGDATHLALCVPHWFVATLLALPALFWLRGLLRQSRRRRRGACRACGYDLRASGGTGRCPECGTPIDAGWLKATTR